MTHRLTSILCALALCLGSPAGAEQALSIDEIGTVTVTGTLNATTITADTVQAANLDATLKSIMEQNAKIIAQNEAILANQTWFQFDTSLAATMSRIVADSTLLQQYEFRIFRNGGPFLLKFSYWNTGLRAMTEPFMTGDTSPYRLGGSLWVTPNNFDPNSRSCPAGQVYHYYYYAMSDGVISRTGNGCKAETAVWARPRPAK